MIKKNLLLFVALSTIVSFELCGQQAIETPQHFGQFYNNPIINIARNGLDSKLEITLDNQSNVGRFNGVSTSYFSLFYTPKSEESSKNTYGIYLYNDKEGDFLFRRKVNFSFARHQQLTESWNLALALSGGIHIFGIKPTKNTGAYSANSFDGNSSLLLYSDKVQFGLAMNQFTNSTIQPVSQQIVLKRHYYLYSQYLWTKGKLDLIPGAYYKYVKINDPLSLQKSSTLGVSLRAVSGIILFGASYDSYGMYFTAGLNKWNLNNNELNIDFTYFVPTAQTNIYVNRMEINLRLKI